MAVDWGFFWWWGFVALLFIAIV